jgi:Holliday junction resolvase
MSLNIKHVKHSSNGRPLVEGLETSRQSLPDLFRWYVGVVCVSVEPEMYQAKIYIGQQEILTFGEFSSESEAQAAGMRKVKEVVVALFKPAFASAL